MKLPQFGRFSDSDAHISVYVLVSCEYEGATLRSLPLASYRNWLNCFELPREDMDNIPGSFTLQFIEIYTTHPRPSSTILEKRYLLNDKL